MKEPKTSTNSFIKVIKLMLLLGAGVMLIVGSSIALRRLCCVRRVTLATTPSYAYILKPTTLFKENTLETAIITLPEGYYAEIISTSPSVARVSYNSITGFLKLDENVSLTSSTPTVSLFETAELQTRTDAGTHLRSTPSTESQKIALIPAGSHLTYIGEISGDTPSDGTTPTWYYVHFDAGATTTHTGYVYAERTLVISGKEKRTATQPSASSTLNTTTPESPVTPETKTDERIETPSTLSSGLKIFLIILFATLGIIIFALLLISPRGEKKEKIKTPSPSLGENTEKLPHISLPAYSQPEFGEFVDFTQPKNQNTKINSSLKKHRSIKKELNLLSREADDSSSARLPKPLARYFKAEPTMPSSPDDELL